MAIKFHFLPFLYCSMTARRDLKDSIIQLLSKAMFAYLSKHRVLQCQQNEQQGDKQGLNNYIIRFLGYNIYNYQAS